MSILDELFTARTAASYLGISKQAINQSKTLRGFLLTAKVRLYSHAELEFYRAQGVGRGRLNHVPYPYEAAYIQQVRANVLIQTQAAAFLGINLATLRGNKSLQRFQYRLDDYAVFYLKADLDDYLAEKRRK